MANTGNKVDFERLRKRRQRAQALKRLLALGVIVAIVGGVVALNSLLIETGFTVRVSDMVESFGGSGFPVPVPGGIIRDVKAMGSHLAVLNDTNLHIYNSKGKTVASLQQMTDSTVLVATPERVLTYALGSKRYAVDTRSKNLLTEDTDYSILCGDMNDRGDLAIVTTSKQYVAEVAVYDSRFDFIYGWQWSDNMVVDVALSPKGNILAAGCVNTRGGMLHSILYLLDFAAEQELAKVEFPDEMLLETVWLDTGAIGLLTDKQYRVVGPDGGVLASYVLEEGQLAAMERSGRETLLLMDQKETRTQRLILLDADCKVLAQLLPERRIRDMALGDRKVYLLSDGGISTLDKGLLEQQFHEERGIGKIRLVRGKLYYLTQEEIRLLGG